MESFSRGVSVMSRLTEEPETIEPEIIQPELEVTQ